MILQGLMFQSSREEDHYWDIMRLLYWYWDPSSQATSSTLPKNFSFANRAPNIMSSLEHFVEHLAGSNYGLM